MSGRPDIAAVLAAHDAKVGPLSGCWACPCGERSDPTPIKRGGPSADDRREAYRAHLVEAIEAELAAAEERAAAASEPCDEEKHSWDHFRPGQVDSYWMRCHRVGEHTEHENSETGATWTTS